MIRNILHQLRGENYSQGFMLPATSRYLIAKPLSPAFWCHNIICPSITRRHNPLSPKCSLTQINPSDLTAARSSPLFMRIHSIRATSVNGGWEQLLSDPMESKTGRWDSLSPVVCDRSLSWNVGQTCYSVFVLNPRLGWTTNINLSSVHWSAIFAVRLDTRIECWDWLD